VISDSVPGQIPEPIPSGGEPSISSTPRPKWLIPGAAAVVVLAVAIGLVAGITLTNRGGSATGAASYVPAESAVYYELRLDLPGDQRAALRSFLGHFPQLDVDKYLTDELDQQLDQLTATMPSGYRYSTDVKPWFDGTLAFAVVRYPSMMPGANASVPDVLVLAGVKHPTTAASVNDRVRADATKAGATITSTTHGGVTIWSAKGGSSETTAGMPHTFAWAITADQLVAGTSADLVGKALDTHSGAAPSLASRDEFSAGLARLPADRVLTASFDLKALLTQFRSDLASAQPSAAAIVSEIASRSPTFGVVSARFENDRFVTDSSSTLPSAAPANADRGLAALTPNDAIFFADSSNVGKGLADSLTYLKGVLAATGGIGNKGLDQVEAALGGDFGSFVSWMGDTAVVAGDTKGTPWVGLISNPTDAQAAQTKLQQLQALLQLASANGGPRVQITDADHAGTRITTIQFEATNQTPSWASTLQYAITDQRVVIGSGNAFVARVLDMQSTSSLGADPRFRAALDSVGGTTNSGAFWFDLTALRAALEPLVPADGQSVYQSNVKPWVAPFDYLVGASKADGQEVESRIAIVVK
jgi:hypothetical protein